MSKTVHNERVLKQGYARDIANVQMLCKNTEVFKQSPK